MFAEPAKALSCYLPAVAVDVGCRPGCDQLHRRCHPDERRILAGEVAADGDTPFPCFIDDGPESCWHRSTISFQLVAICPRRADFVVAVERDPEAISFACSAGCLHNDASHAYFQAFAHGDL